MCNMTYRIFQNSNLLFYDINIDNMLVISNNVF